MLKLENAKKSFKSAKGIFKGKNSEANFYHQLAHMIPDTIDVDNLVLAIKIALKDEQINGNDCLGFIGLVPKYIQQIATPEFSRAFREKYIREVLGLTQDPLPDVDYGYVEVEPDVIDISNKDRGAVLAALYNAVVPMGAGEFMAYNPLTWNQEIGNLYFEKAAELDSDGSYYISRILGRCIKCRFQDNLVYVKAYNYENEDGLAQRAIATVPNLEKENIKTGQKTLKKQI